MIITARLAFYVCREKCGTCISGNEILGHLLVVVSSGMGASRTALSTPVTVASGHCWSSGIIGARTATSMKKKVKEATSRPTPFPPNTYPTVLYISPYISPHIPPSPQVTLNDHSLTPDQKAHNLVCFQKGPTGKEMVMNVTNTPFRMPYSFHTFNPLHEVHHSSGVPSKMSVFLGARHSSYPGFQCAEINATVACGPDTHPFLTTAHCGQILTSSVSTHHPIQRGFLFTTHRPYVRDIRPASCGFGGLRIFAPPHRPPPPPFPSSIPGRVAYRRLKANDWVSCCKP